MYHDFNDYNLHRYYATVAARKGQTAQAPEAPRSLWAVLLSCLRRVRSREIR